MNRNILALSLLALAGPGQASMLIQEMGLHVMLEASAAALTTVGDYTVQNPDAISNGSARIGAGGIAWSGQYADSGWSYTGSGLFGGLALTMNLSATVAGSEGSNINMTVVGSGMLGSQPLQMQGSASWLYDAVFDDYFKMDFAQQTKIGAASWYGWVRGNESYGCIKADTVAGNGTFSGPIAGAPVELTSIASLGKKSAVGSGHKCWTPVPLDLFTGLTSIASLGKRGGLLVSRLEKSALSPTAVAAPALPAAVSNYLDPGNQASVVQVDGQLDGDDMFNRYRSSGSHAAGSFSGITHDVPEPGSGGLLALALLGLVLGGLGRPQALSQPA